MQKIYRLFYLAFIILLISSALILASCSRPSEEYFKKVKIRSELKVDFDQSCPLGYMDNSKDWLVANIFFKDFQTTLSQEDKLVIKKVAELHNECPEQILLIGYASSFEGKISFISATRISFQRAQSVLDQLKSNNITGNYINILFCSDTKNLVDEKKNPPNAKYYNQRVDIVFLNSEVSSHNLDCLVDNTKNQK